MKITAEEKQQLNERVKTNRQIFKDKINNLSDELADKIKDASDIHFFREIGENSRILTPEQLKLKAKSYFIKELSRQLTELL